MVQFQPAATGFFGKLPARGDFLRHGLPEAVVAALDPWCRHCLTVSREMLGEDWEAAWMSAPIWRFLLPPGSCLPQAILGVWLPSMDKVGRHFPFILCALANTVAELAQGGNWLEAAAAAGLAGVVEDAAPERIAAALQANFDPATLPKPGWWTEGSPFVAGQHRDYLTLFPGAQAGLMLRDVQLMENSQ